MPLTTAQIDVLKSPLTRQRFAAQSANFAYADKLLRESGVSCPRLPYVWNAIFDDAASREWLTVSFPGVVPTPPAASPSDPKPNQNTPEPAKTVERRPVGVVGKAITMLQSARRIP